MSTLMLVNPRRKRRASTKKRRTRSTHRRTRVTALRHNPRYKTRRRWSTKRRSVGTHVARMRRNPRRSRRSSSARAMSVKGFLNHTLMPATVGAGGGLLLNLALGYLPLPTALNSNFVKPIVGLAGAAAIGMIGSKVAGRRAGEQMAAGAAVVVIYGVLKNIINTAAPSLPLSDYNTMGWTNPGLPVGYSMGEYVGRAAPAAGGGVVQPMPQSMGEYVGF